jgi:MerR family transcriptional regulator, copper efflux regulator
MLISEFARVTGLTRDTVRFYARLGLLQPQTNCKGGRHPYSAFTDKDIQAAEAIRIAQALGMSLKEIAAVNQERRNGELTCERSLEITSAQLLRLEAKATELEMMIGYVRAKIDWLTRGKQGPQPAFGSYTRRGSRVTVDNTGKPLPENDRNGSCSVSSSSVS